MGTGIGSVWGGSLLDLLDHLVSQAWQIGDGADYFHDGGVPDCPFGARLDLGVFGIGIGTISEPWFFVDLRYEGGELQLWHGWEDKTYHLARAWLLGDWRQDISEPLQKCGLFLSTIGTVRQVTSLEAAHQEVERELTALFRRLDTAMRTGRYVLTWAEVAAMLIRFKESWNNPSPELHDDQSAELVRDTYAQLVYRERDEPLELRIIHRDSKEPLITIRPTRDRWGWRIDILTTLRADEVRLQLDCPWFGSIVFSGESVNPPPVRPCPLGHGHQGNVEPTAPWSLFEFFREDWLPSLNDRYVRWGVSRYQPVPRSQRILVDPSGMIWRWLSEIGLPNPTYRGTDPKTGHQYWELAGLKFLTIVDPVNVEVVAYLLDDH